VTQLRDIMTDVFYEWDGANFAPGLRLADVPGWDSMSVVNLILALENSAGVSLRDVKWREVATVGDLAGLIRQRGGKVA
jgi:acyl carrier protein